MSCQRRQTDKQFPTDGTEVYLIMYYLFSVENKLRRDTTVYSLRSCWGCVYEQILNKHSIVKTRTSRVQTKANSRPTNVNQSNLIKSDLKCSFRVSVHARKTNQTAWRSVHHSNFSPGSSGRTKAGRAGEKWFSPLNSRKGQRTNQKYRNLVGSDQQMQWLAWRNWTQKGWPYGWGEL